MKMVSCGSKDMVKSQMEMGEGVTGNTQEANDFFSA